MYGHLPIDCCKGRRGPLYYSTGQWEKDIYDTIIATINYTRNSYVNHIPVSYTEAHTVHSLQMFTGKTYTSYDPIISYNMLELTIF